MADTAKRVTLPRIDTSTAWLKSDTDDTVEARLRTSVAEVLGLEEENVQMIDSFVDLGGNRTSAMALRRACMNIGMAVKTTDVLRCQTLAELQTCITPCARQSVEPATLGSLMIAPVEPQFTKQSSTASLSDRSSLHSRTSSDSNNPSTSNEKRNEVEDYIASRKSISRAVMVKPRAGLFDGKLVAIVSLTSLAGRESTCTDIDLVAQSQMLFAGTHVAAVRRDLDASGLVGDRPQFWAVLETMPLNEAGQIDRRALRTWIQNANEELYQRITYLDTQLTLQLPETEMEKSLQRLVARTLQISPDYVGMNFSFVQLGGDEVAAMALVTRCRLESIFLNLHDVLRSATISELALAGSQRGGLVHKWDVESKEDFDLSSMQQLYFHTSLGKDSCQRKATDGSYRFNQSVLLRVPVKFNLEDIAAAVDAVVAHHSMLRARFIQTPQGWKQRIVPDIEGSYGFNHYSISTDDHIESVISQTQAAINLEDGPVFSVAHFSTDDGHQMMYIVAHHLVIDLLSWRVIIQDLDELIQNGSLSSHRSMPFQKWIDISRQEAANLAIEMPFDLSPADYQYWGLLGASNTYGNASEVSFSLSPELTALLQTTCNQALQTDPVDIYLAALLLSFSQTFHDRRPPSLWNQEHGRETDGSNIDISDTVGWFTTLCPIAPLEEDYDDFIDILRRVKDQRRSTQPVASHYFASRLGNSDRVDSFSSSCPFEIIFSYSGAFQTFVQESGIFEQMGVPGRTLASRTSDIGSNVGRIAVFEINAMVHEGAAKIRFIFNQKSRHQEKIATWIHNYEHLLLEAIGRLRYHSPELTLADVPRLSPSYAGLARLNKTHVASLGLSSVRDIESIIPITPNQQAILVAQAKDSAACHLHMAYEVTAPNGDAIDVSRICAAWEHVVTRHSVLRTVFVESITDNALYDAIVLRKYSPDMLFVDLSPVDDPIESMNLLPAARSTTTPAHRLSVCRTPMKTFVRLDVSSALCDTLSIAVLFSELKRAYAATTAPLEINGFSLLDYVECVNVYDRAASLDFWRESLSKAKPCIFPQLASAPNTGGREKVHVGLDIELADMLTFAKAHKTSTDAIIRLAWGLLLRAYTGSNTPCFGYRAAGREPCIEGVPLAVGCFATVIPCCLSLLPHMPLFSALTSVRKQHETSLQHQHIPLPDISHIIGFRGSDRLFNSCLAYTEPLADLDRHHRPCASVEFRSILRQESSDQDLFVEASFTCGKLEVNLDCSILSQSQAHDVASTFGCAIQAILGAPNGSVGGVDLFSDRDYAQIVSWSGDTPTSTRSETLLHELIFVQTVQRPDNQAVCASDGEFSYLQLEESANQLAHVLVDAGLEMSTPVPVFLDKTRWSIVAMLAVIKAGGALIPIDANDTGLTQAICQHIDAKIAVTCDAANSSLGGLFEKVIILDSDLISSITSPLFAPDRPPLALPNPGADACIFFTPVSSREVRGIAYTHSALSTTCIAQGPAAGINHTSRVMQLSSFNNDIAISEVFTTLVQGGCVCIPTAQERFQDLTGAVKRMNANWSQMTPILARKLNVDALPSLRTVCFRTRSLDSDTYAPWAGKKRVILAYGAPDVCPLGISFLEVHGPHHLRCIGKPIFGSVWIVNSEDHRKLMPVGTLGELVIGGPALARAYGSSRDPSSLVGDEGTGNSRYYKTGHTVRYIEGGMIEYVGSMREDLVLKGHTVNLGEIEQQLRKCLGQGVDAIVEAISFNGTGRTPVLAAFIELGSLFDGSEDLSQLSKTTRERLSTIRQLFDKMLPNSLPSIMIPKVLIPLKHLPITNSLKINRRKLQRAIQGLSQEHLLSLSSSRNTRGSQSIGLKVLPLTETEEQMRAIWARLLVTDESAICTTDGFLKAGGDDVLAVSLVIACRQAGFSVSLADVLRDAALTELCRSITAAACDDVSDDSNSQGADDAVHTHPSAFETLVKQVIVPRMGIEAEMIKQIAEASSVQMQHVESGLRAGRAGIDYLVFGFTGPVNSQKLEKSLQLLINTHPVLRTAFVAHNRKLYQVVLKAFNAEFKKFLCPSWRLSAFTEKIIKKDQNTPVGFHLPPTKFVLLDAGKQSTLIMRLSKAQYDDASITLLVKDLKRLYDGSQNQPRRPSYCDYIEGAQFSNSNGAEQYWKTFLKDASMTQVVAHNKPPQLSNHIKTIRQRISVGSLPSLGVGFETVLKGAWAMILATLSASSDVIFGEVIEGRHLRLPRGHTVSGVLGPTANTVPVRVHFPDYPLSPLGLLQYIQGQRIAGIPYENFGMYEMIEKCTPWHYWSRLSTVVQHQREGSAIEAGESKMFHLGTANCKFTLIESKVQDIPDLFIHSVMQGTGEVDLAMTFCEDRIPGSFAQETLQALCDTVDVLTSVGLMQPIIPVGSHYESMQPQIPLPQAPDEAITNREAQMQQAFQLECQIPPDQMFMIQAFIADAWTAVLDARALGVPQEHLHNAAFYDLWGSLIPAAEFANYFRRELPKLGLADVDFTSFNVTMEDIIEHPTMRRQFELLARKLYGDARSKHRGEPSSSSPTSTRSRSIAVSNTLGKSIRRLTSTVSRATPTIRHPFTPVLQQSSPPLTEAVSPMTPMGQFPPLLPSLPAFSPVAEEPDPLYCQGAVADDGAAGRPRSNTSSTGESAGSLTGGSSASSGEDEDDELHHQDQTVTAVAWTEDFDTVSPLTPVAVKALHTPTLGTSHFGNNAALKSMKKLSMFGKRVGQSN